MSTVEEIQSAPEDLFLLPHGVLHVVTISCHKEYSIWSVFGAIWSTLEFSKEVNFYCPMQYSILPQKVVIRSTSYDLTKSALKHSILHQKRAIWSTPHGSNLRPYGVLHRALKTSLMELFVCLLK